MTATVVSLFCYPVKGCAGIALRSARVLARGIEHDRRWMIVDAARHRFVSQRELPAMARLRPSLLPDRLRLALPDGSELDLALDDRGEPLKVEVWHDQVDAVAPSAAADLALSRMLGRKLRLVRFPEASRRPCDPDYAPATSHTGFADGFPLLVTSEGSLAELNAALPPERGSLPLPMDRFRPNIVLAGLPPRAEDDARSVRFAGGLQLLLVKPCDRCAVTTVDQASGESTGAEPIPTLRRIRRNPRTGGVMFGQNGVPILTGAAAADLCVGETATLG